MTTPLLALSLLALGPLLLESAAPSDPAPQVGGDKKKVQRPGSAAQDAERHARELEAIAQRLEEVAASAAAAAEDARARATRARNRADALHAGRPAEPPRVGDGGFGPVAPPRPGAGKGGNDERPPVFRRQDPGQGQQPKAPDAGTTSPVVGPALVAQVSPTETSPFGGLKVAQVHAAASRSAAENKQAFLKLKRAQRGWGNDRATMKRSFTFKPGEAPDMADLDIYGEWQWAINIARGSADFAGSAPGAVARNGNVDYARLRIQPAKGTFAEEKMKWGLRRYNLGDTTVVDCDFTGIPQEHGIYDALAGHALYLGNTFLDLGGQGIQIAHRDRPFQQYKADNLEYAAPPLIIVDDCHAVDCGKFAARSGFTWTFFDPGNPKMPGTVILRGSTSVHAWDFGRTTGGDAAKIDAPDAIRSPGGLVVQHYRARMEGEPETFATKALVVDRCVFDHTKSAMPIMAIRGVETILIEDSCFIARGCKIPFVDIDDLAGQPSGKVILQNCVSPEGSLVQLRIGRKVVSSMNCPGKRVEIDVATRSVRVLEPKDEPLTRVIHPLGGRVVEPGIHPQPGGHVDALGPIEVPALGAGD